MHIPKDERKKLDSKSRKCILLGYGTTTKGYRLYDPLKKVFHSRDVIFNERKCGFEEPSPTQKDPEPLVYLKYSDEPSKTAEPSVSAVRRSECEKRQTDFYGFQCNFSGVKEPKSVSDALTNQESADAMKAEIDFLHDNSVWDLVQLPEGRKPVGSKWIFKVKTSADGSVERCKARLFAQGYSQKEGLDYDETFSSVVRSESVRSVITLASKNGLKLHQLDITTAFLNGDLDEEVYMKQPEGFLVKDQEHLVCRLRKSIYGLKQSPRCWNQALDAKLKLMVFKQSTSDTCIYTSTTESGGLFILVVYVDDILLAGKSQQKFAQVKADLRK